MDQYNTPHGSYLEYNSMLTRTDISLHKKGKR